MTTDHPHHENPQRDCITLDRTLSGIDLLFKVMEVAPSGDGIIATADNLAVARAAFDTAVSLWPGAAIELRQKARVIASSEAK
jgi:hypothetical protein